jgi:hypothetical protein
MFVLLSAVGEIVLVIRPKVGERYTSESTMPIISTKCALIPLRSVFKIKQISIKRDRGVTSGFAEIAKVGLHEVKFFKGQCEGAICNCVGCDDEGKYECACFAMKTSGLNMMIMGLELDIEIRGRTHRTLVTNLEFQNRYLLERSSIPGISADDLNQRLDVIAQVEEKVKRALELGNTEGGGWYTFGWTKPGMIADGVEANQNLAYGARPEMVDSTKTTLHIAKMFISKPENVCLNEIKNNKVDLEKLFHEEDEAAGQGENEEQCEEDE